MYQLLIIIILLFIAYNIFQNLRGWNGEIIELPTYDNLTLIRKHFSNRNAILIHNFLYKESKEEFEEILEVINDLDKENDIILNNTTLSQIQECVENIPLLFAMNLLWPNQKQYNRIYNSEVSYGSTKHHQIYSICPMQELTIYLKSQNKPSLVKKVKLEPGDLLLFPKRVSFAFEKGTIDYFNYFK